MINNNDKVDMISFHKKIDNKFDFNMNWFQVSICSSEDLDCVESVKIDSNDCLERCDGIIVDAIDENKPKDNSKIKQILAQYENYKFPNKSEVPFPFSLNGKILNVHL